MYNLKYYCSDGNVFYILYDFIVPQHVKDAKEKADKEAKEMAEQLDSEKRGDAVGSGASGGEPEKETKEANGGLKPGSAPSALGTAPQVQGMQSPNVLPVPIGRKYSTV